MAGRVYVAAYIVLTPERLEREIRRLCWTPETGIAERFAASVCERRWQYDTSEDPSFFCARELASEGGCLSWGICRPNLRKPLREGDVVAFIGFEERDPVTYRFCAYATVARKVTPLMIWNDDDLVVYRKYLNLLARPGADGSFEHHEPAPGFHEEWLWIMSDRAGHRDDFRPYKDNLRSYKGSGGMKVRLGIDVAGDRPVDLGCTYVIFERDYPLTFIVDEPLTVAERTRSGRYETWATDEFAKHVWEMTLGRSRTNRRTLCDLGTPGKRRANAHSPHVRLRDDVDAGAWRDEASALLHRFGRQPLT